MRSILFAATRAVVLVAAGCRRAVAETKTPRRGPRGHRHRRLEHGLPDHRGRGRRVPERAPGARITVGISGTGGGFQKFCRDEIDIADASRPIRPSEDEACAKAGVTYIELPVAYDGLAIVVHPKNTWATSMTVAELKKLWEPAAQGKIMRWSQVRAAAGRTSEIHLFGAGVDSGTFDYFTEAIVGKEDAEPRRLHVERGRQRHRAGRERRRARARLLRLRVLRGEQGQAQARRDRRWRRRATARVRFCRRRKR